ncbi:hypothetical protein ABEF92_006478 [Exophiala dermatitidis]|uniref:Transcription elongation factor Eaf N-terminal domain-containing protein n=1 Tax=Exophiala dermatitidis (strain ATCC 34100 / CBS 525.76 / NIH/UT8656) TaxID=858893 RepID=H6BQ93_EXODN|nr:uncharacterized protein HMPREF1120_01947 [Exophiala dermatitidis NIH/UT8656]EHY53763.1 hypothetical protein HMPREF1120_01947 [Exophiala dermatitidis NIH/UT8656]
MASPALHPMRPSGWIDPRRPAEYPIVVGESVKANGAGRSSKSLVTVRYNWQPKSGFGPRDSKLTKSGDDYQLTIRDEDSGNDEEYQYSGAISSSTGRTGEDQTSSLALIYDPAKSCFVLETISASLDLNLKRGASHSTKDARELPQLPIKQSSSTATAQPNGDGGTSPAPDDETPDTDNPYDYRHFLAEARENVEKSALAPGSRTPLTGVSTPVPGGSRFSATTPQFRPTPVPSTSKATPQKTKKQTETLKTRPTSRTATPTIAGKPTAQSKRDSPNKPSSSSKALSKARITDSDEEDEAEADESIIDVARPSAKSSSSFSHLGSRPSASARRGHTRNISANIGSSPHIIINDDDGGLEIDMGSPPPEDRPSRRGRVDPEMFRSHTGTPIGGMSSNSNHAAGNSRPMSQARPSADETHNHGRGRKDRDRDRDVTMKDIEAGTTDEDGDVEEFELGSPRDKLLSVPNSGDVSQIDGDDDDTDGQRDGRHQDQTTHSHSHSQHQQGHAATSTAHHDDDEDDEDLLAAALEAALEEEDQAATPAAATSAAVGLGIGMATQDDESEVSEEE